MRTVRTVRVEIAMTPELVAEIDACRGKGMARSRWIEDVVRMWLGYRLDVRVLTPTDGHDDDNEIPLSLELLEVLCARCIDRDEKPADVLARMYGVAPEERLVVRRPVA